MHSPGHFQTACCAACKESACECCRGRWYEEGILHLCSCGHGLHEPLFAEPEEERDEEPRHYPWCICADCAGMEGPFAKNH